MKLLNIAVTLLLAMVANIGFSQAKKPTLMVFPADDWCIKHGYFTEKKDADGNVSKEVNYERALQEDTDLVNVITKINELMTEQGIDVKDMTSAVKSIRRTSVEDAQLRSASNSSTRATTPYEELKNRANADIMMEVAWQINNNGPKKSVTYRLRGLDSYTDKQVAAAQGTGKESMSASVPVLMEEAVIGKMDNFVSQLQSHFDDMMENGREISMRVLVFNGTGISLEDEYDGDELREIIEDWVADNTVGHRYSVLRSGETELSLEQVRIPLYNEKGRAIDAQRFVGELRKFLAKPPYSIVAKVTHDGLGHADIILGEK